VQGINIGCWMMQQIIEVLFTRFTVCTVDIIKNAIEVQIASCLGRELIFIIYRVLVYPDQVKVAAGIHRLPPLTLNLRQPLFCQS
jgi:hypothetical protein